jgi:hypothetical protein
MNGAPTFFLTSCDFFPIYLTSFSYSVLQAYVLFHRKAMMIDTPVPQTTVVNLRRIILFPEESRQTPLTPSLSLELSSPNGCFYTGYCSSFR